MDSFLAITKRLTLAFVVLASCVLFPRESFALDTYAMAMSKCKDLAASRRAQDIADGYTTYNYECRPLVGGNGSTSIDLFDNRGNTQMSDRQGFLYGGPICGGLQPRQGELQLDTTSTQRACDGSCEYAMTSGDQDSNGLGQSIMKGTWTPTGHQCSTTSPGFDGSPQPPPANLCAKGSCMNPNNGDVCSYDATGKQMCVGGPIAQGPGGACTGSDAGAICAGQKPPLPTPPQLSQITDPATEITGSDHYTHTSTPTDGGLPIVTPINVNTYGVGGPQQSPTTSGQTGADKGPAPASTAGGKSTGSYAGGSDCNSPPACSGDPVMCGVARQQWYSMCQAHKDADQAHKDLTGDGSPPDFDQLKNQYGQGDVWTDNPGNGLPADPIATAANNGSYDQSGFGYSRQCPLKDFTVDAGHAGTFVVKLQNLCMVGDWVRGLIIAMALYAAFCITAGSSMKGVG